MRIIFSSLIVSAGIVVAIALGLMWWNIQLVDESKSTVDFMSVYAQDVYKTTWDDCVKMYDELTCAVIGQELVESSGKTFNHTKPSETELPSYEENPYFWDCVEDYKEEYDKSESVGRDLCKDLLK